jgi:hypothetical protein
MSFLNTDLTDRTDKEADVDAQAAFIPIEN